MKNKLASLKKLAHDNARRTGALVAGTLAASASYADEATQTAINAAYTDGVSDLTVAVGGLIGLVAVVVGVGMIISMLRKG